MLKAQACNSVISSPYQFERLVAFLDFVNSRKPALQSTQAPNRYNVHEAPVQLESTFRPQLKPKEIDDPRQYELDDIAKKLESVSHKLGRPISSQVPVPLESNNDESEFFQIQYVRSDPTMPLNRLPLAVQELCIIEDLLFLIMNLDGKYFSYHQGALHTSKNIMYVDEGVDSSILSRFKPVLKAAFCCSRLLEFVAEKTRMKTGLVLQAFANALDVLLKEFFQVVVALDRKFKARELGLHQFCFHLSPYTRSLQSLLHLTFEVETREIGGGALIKTLEDKIAAVSGDRQLRATYAALLDGSTRPFLEILGRWLSSGSFNDPHHEFLITDTKKNREGTDLVEANAQEDYFSSRYVLNTRNAPRLLEDLQQKILLTGIYRNIRTHLSKTLDKAISKVSEVSLIPQWDRRSLNEIVSAAFSEVNNSLMNSLFQSSKLFSIMCAAKSFFFVEKGDFLDNFLSTADFELKRSSKEVHVHQLQPLFELSLKNSSMINNPFQESFTCELASNGLYDSLVKIIQSSDSSTSGSSATAGQNAAAANKTPKVSELLSMNMKVEFPESLIMNSKAIAKYQIVFRHITHCVELIRGLAVPLSRHSSVKATQLRHFETMKQAMLQFVRTVHYYICYNVLEPQWERFAAAIQERKFVSVEEITATHMDFLDTCLRECMLTNSKLVQLLSMIWSTCFKFSALIVELNSRIEVLDHFLWIAGANAFLG